MVAIARIHNKHFMLQQMIKIVNVISIIILWQN